MSEHENKGQHEGQHGENNHRRRQAQEQEQARQQQAGQAQPGQRIQNPAQPLADTEIPPRADASSFMREGADTTHPSGYPKLKYHPVHGGIVVKDPGEESNLFPKTDWFDSPELADAARTHTEAEIVRVNNQMVKLRELEERGHPVVRNSVQSDESIRNAYPEPL